ncbi:MAG TPA: MraY family glycosyltransferase [Acidimicrobiales bacterium]|nr:MraY family glycosyltransferase [Acidimicrobiales bacterium]
MTEWQEIAMLGGLALALSAVLVPLARRAALRLGITDRPAAGKHHAVPTPYLGGVAIAVAVVGVLATQGWTGEVSALVGAALLVSCIGLVDDVRTARPAVRLAVETTAACIVFAAGARVEVFGGPIDLILTVIWLVGLTNAYNFLDNMDACAAAILCVSTTALLAAAALEGQYLVATLASVILGASVGFLLYNWHPARIFLGDAGSLFLGFLVSATALKIRFPTGHLPGFVAVVCIAGPALFDMTLVVISRVRAGRPVYIGGTDHTSHRLLRLGVSTRQVGVLFAVVTAATGSLGVAIGRGAVDWWFVSLPLLVAAALLTTLLRLPAGATPAQVHAPGVDATAGGRG